MALDILGVPSRPDGLPTVTAMICAYNYEQFVGRAIESALAQDYPAELLEILVIEDGSTDSTPAIVDDYAQRHPGRIRVVHHANMGYIPSTNVGLGESRGDLIALLDADDAWRPQKTRRQVELFQADPTLGLVFCDMAVVDAEDAVLQPSKLAEYGPISENRFAALMYENFATTSSIMVRASLRDAFCPIRLDVPGDWWIARAVALRAGLDYVPESLALYRMHGSNMSVGGTKAIVVENKRAIAHQLWGLRHLPLERLNAQEILHAWSGVERHAQFGVQAGGSFFFDSMDRHPGDAEHVEALLAQADEAATDGDSLAEARLALKALAWDPFRLETRTRLHESVARAADEATLPDPFPGARPYRMLVDARELLEGDEMMHAYIEAMSGSEAVTLVIDASQLPGELAETQLRGLVDRCGLEGREDIDLVAVVGSQTEPERRRMLGAVQARYARREQTAGRKPVFTPTSLQRAIVQAA